MEQNKVLLSQSEIDTLLAFLFNKKENVDVDVLDQENIDKLIVLLQANGKYKLRLDTNIPTIRKPLGAALLVLDGYENLEEEQTSCILYYNEDPATHYLQILCRNNHTGHVFNITPSCIEQRRYFIDNETHWGYCIPPVVFNQISVLLNVQYTKDTYNFICQRFAKINYGDANAAIPSYYMPLEEALLPNLIV